MCFPYYVILQSLQQRVADLEAALERERQRAEQLEGEVAQLRQKLAMHGPQHGGSLPTPAATALAEAQPGSAFSLQQPEPSAVTAAAAPGDVSAAAAALAAGAVHPLAAAAAALNRAASSPAALPPRLALAGSTSGSTDDDMVLISRRALELLHLKERAMDAVKEGVTIADCSKPDMPLI